MRMIRSFHFQLIFVTSLILLTALMLTTGIVFSQYRSSMAMQNERDTLRAFAVSESKIEHVLSDAYNASLLIKQSAEVDNYLLGTFESETEKMVAKRAMMHALSDRLANNYSLNGILFFKDDGTMFGLKEPWRMSYEIASHPFYEKLNAEQLPIENGITWLGGYLISEFTLQPADNPAAEDIMIIGANRMRYRYSYTDQIQMLTTLFSIDDAALRDCFDVLIGENEEIYLLDAAGRQLIGGDVQLLGTQPWFLDSLAQGEKFGTVNASSEGEKFQIVFYRLASTGWMLAKQIPYSVYTEQTDRLSAVTWLAAALVMLLMGTVYTLFAMRFTRPFKNMSAALERVRKGDLNVALQQDSKVYEFQLMYTEFNSMIGSIRELLMQTKAMEHERIQLELRNLQSQLNPHMVFNSITAIRWMATMSGADKVSDMLVELAELIRPVFSEWRLTWTLRDEISYIGHYVKLLRLRYGGFIHVEIVIADELYDERLPCFTLQPLLENSAEHGSRAQEVLSILLEGRLEGEYVRFKVSDNGRGIPPEKLKQIKDSMAGKEQEQSGAGGRTGIGIVNISRRLAMFSGGNSQMLIESEEGRGTTITFRLLRADRT